MSAPNDSVNEKPQAPDQSNEHSNEKSLGQLPKKSDDDLQQHPANPVEHDSDPPPSGLLSSAQEKAIKEFVNCLGFQFEVKDYVKDFPKAVKAVQEIDIVSAFTSIALLEPLLNALKHFLLMWEKEADPSVESDNERWFGEATSMASEVEVFRKLLPNLLDLLPQSDRPKPHDVPSVSTSPITGDILRRTMIALRNDYPEMMKTILERKRADDVREMKGTILTGEYTLPILFTCLKNVAMGNNSLVLTPRVDAKKALFLEFRVKGEETDNSVEQLNRLGYSPAFSADAAIILSPEAQFMRLFAVTNCAYYTPRRKNAKEVLAIVVGFPKDSSEYLLILREEHEPKTLESIQSMNPRLILRVTFNELTPAFIETTEGFVPRLSNITRDQARLLSELKLKLLPPKHQSKEDSLLSTVENIEVSSASEDDDPPQRKSRRLSTMKKVILASAPVQKENPQKSSSKRKRSYDEEGDMASSVREQKERQSEEEEHNPSSTKKEKRPAKRQKISDESSQKELQATKAQLQQLKVQLLEQKRLFEDLRQQMLQTPSTTSQLVNFSQQPRFSSSSVPSTSSPALSIPVSSALPSQNPSPSIRSGVQQVHPSSHPSTPAMFSGNHFVQHVHYHMLPSETQDPYNNTICPCGNYLAGISGRCPKCNRVF